MPAELLSAVKAGDEQAVRALTSLGEKYPQAELTASLIAAAENGHASMCTLLLDVGADSNAQDGRHNYPLRAAISSGDHPTILALLQRSANPNLETPRGTPLLVACQSEGSLETVALLLDHGADINHETKDGYTPLTAAVRDNKRFLCQLLLRRGADPHQKCMGGSISAFDIAQQKVLPDIYSLLMQSSITSTAEQALAESEQRQQQARAELEQAMAAEHAKLQEKAADDKQEVSARVQALRSENEELLSKYNFKRK